MNRLVVIADGNGARARRLADACERAGIPARAASHGAEALEIALQERPGVVVARGGLPLVDGAKLAEILRANPRTRGTRFLFVEESDPNGLRSGVGDVILSGVADPDEILPTVEELIVKQDRITLIDAETEGDGEAEGELSQLPLAELLQLFHVNRKNGRLDLLGHGDGDPPQRGRIAVRDGEIVSAQLGAVEGAKALFRMLGWRHGRFVFEPGQPDDVAKIPMPTRALLVEGVRQLDEWNRLATQLPPLDAQVKMRVKASELPPTVHPLTQEVLLLLELYPTVRDVVDHCSYPDYQALRTVHTLVNREIVELGQVLPPTTAAPSTSGLFDDAQRRRLRSWVQGRRAGRSPRRTAKLLVAAAEPEATPDLANLLRRVPGVRLAPEYGHRALGSDELAVMGRIALDEEMSIELVHLPIGEEFAALWPLAGHGALGTLFLLKGSVGDAAERLAPISAALQALPHARTFHVVILGKDERISPDELQENLSLIDEASLFLLPVESPKEPAAVLRRLFARIVP